MNTVITREKENTAMLTVTLSHDKNPDIDGGYWQDANATARRHVLPIQNIKAASAVCRQYIEKNGLGGGNWTGGQVESWTEDGRREQVARVSYNGRAWDMMSGKEIST